MDASKPPISRAALERVLARAAELQSATGEEAEPDTLTEAQVVELGREVGLSPAALRQALAEERSRLVPVRATDGMMSRALGGTGVAAQRIVKGTPPRVLEMLDRWMQRDELLRVVRQRPDSLMWEPSRNVVGNLLRRAFADKDYALVRAATTSATAVPVDDASSLVRLEADFSNLRAATIKSTLAGGVVGGAFTAAAVVANVMIPLAVLPILAVTGAAYLGGRNAHHKAMERALLALEQVLDRLERGESEPPSLRRMIETVIPPRR